MPRDFSVISSNSLLAPLPRPALLVRAARIGADRYRRARHLPSMIRSSAVLANGLDQMEILRALRAAEAQLESARRSSAPGYASQRHVGVLAGLIAEMKTARVYY